MTEIPKFDNGKDFIKNEKVLINEALNDPGTVAYQMKVAGLSFFIANFFGGLVFFILVLWLKWWWATAPCAILWILAAIAFYNYHKYRRFGYNDSVWSKIGK